MSIKFHNKKRGKNNNFVYKLKTKKYYSFKHENKSLISTLII